MNPFNFNRRSLLRGLGLLSAASLGTSAAQQVSAADTRSPQRTRVQTPNGRSAESKLVDGVREFHLTASEFEHEFAPGCRARCWGYNGSTPGPTLEAWEGEQVRILVTNQLPEPTTIHWHGILLPNGMDGVAGLTQPAIQPGETWVYEFTLRNAGTFMYHPHADEMVQMAYGMMGMFIVHPKDGEPEPIDRDYTILLHNWALHPGTWRPDPTVMQAFDLWTFNSKVFPATAPLVARLGERVRLRVGNLSMWNHPMHLHGHRFHVTGGDGGRWPRSAWIPEVTHIVGVGQTRDLEFVADTPGDWALHCHMSHHTMNAMGHEMPNFTGARTDAVDQRLGALLPGYMSMGRTGMGGMGEMAQMMGGPPNTLPMMMGTGPHGAIEMGGMFTVIKVREQLPDDPIEDWYPQPRGSVARKLG